MNPAKLKLVSFNFLNFEKILSFWEKWPILRIFLEIFLQDHGTYIWSNFMRMHIDKKVCHFFTVNQSSLLRLIFIEIAWASFLLLKSKLLIKNWIKNRPKGVPKKQNIFLLLAIIKFYSLNYTQNISSTETRIFMKI